MITHEGTNADMVIQAHRKVNLAKNDLRQAEKNKERAYLKVKKLEQKMDEKVLKIVRLALEAESINATLDVRYFYFLL